MMFTISGGLKDTLAHLARTVITHYGNITHLKDFDYDDTLSFLRSLDEDTDLTFVLKLGENQWRVKGIGGRILTRKNLSPRGVESRLENYFKDSKDFFAKRISYRFPFREDPLEITYVHFNCRMQNDETLRGYYFF